MKSPILDYEADFTVGGPLIPGVSEKLGDLRFLASYRNTQTAYIIPQARDSYTNQNVSLKLTSNIAQGMKLTVNGFIAQDRGMNKSDAGFNGQGGVEIDTGILPAFPWQNTGSQILHHGRRERGGNLLL